MGRELNHVVLKVTPLNEPSPTLLKKIIDLETEAFGVGALNEWFLPVLIRYGRLFLLEHDVEIVGVAHFVRDWRESKSAFMSGFCVKEEFRGRGYGARFLSQVLEQLSADGVASVKLTVFPENQRARRFYERFGFKAEGWQPDEYGPGQERLLMKVELGPLDSGPPEVNI